MAVLTDLQEAQTPKALLWKDFERSTLWFRYAE
jgi:hypothetical protein